MVVMLVEDEVHVQFFIWKLLQADGFTVLAAGSGEAAPEISRNHPGPVDLLLTDLEMPRMDGLELCRILAGERHTIKMLMMSGDLRAKEQASEKGIPFLEKPFTPAALRDAVQAVLQPIPRSE